MEPAVGRPIQHVTALAVLASSAELAPLALHRMHAPQAFFALLARHLHWLVQQAHSMQLQVPLPCLSACQPAALATFPLTLAPPLQMAPATSAQLVFTAQQLVWVMLPAAAHALLPLVMAAQLAPPPLQMLHCVGLAVSAQVARLHQQYPA